MEVGGVVEWKWVGTAPMVQGEWKIQGWTLKERLDKEKEEAELDKEKEEAELEGEQMVTIPPWDGEEEEEPREREVVEGEEGGPGSPTRDC